MGFAPRSESKRTNADPINGSLRVRAIAVTHGPPFSMEKQRSRNFHRAEACRLHLWTAPGTFLSGDVHGYKTFRAGSPLDRPGRTTPLLGPGSKLHPMV